MRRGATRGLLPADKVGLGRKAAGPRSPEKELAFVGDGINDAPVLMRADIGIAMGALGSDAAIEAADIVLMDDDPAKISLAMRISRKCMRIVYAEYRLCPGGQGALPGSDGAGHHQHVVGRLRRCRRHGPGRAERDPDAECERVSVKLQ